MARGEDDFEVFPSDILLEGVGHRYGGISIHYRRELVYEDYPLGGRYLLRKFGAVLLPIGELAQGTAPRWDACQPHGA